MTQYNLPPDSNDDPLANLRHEHSEYMALLDKTLGRLGLSNTMPDASGRLEYQAIASRIVRISESSDLFSGSERPSPVLIVAAAVELFLLECNANDIPPRVDAEGREMLVLNLPGISRTTVYDITNTSDVRGSVRLLINRTDLVNGGGTIDETFEGSQIPEGGIHYHAQGTGSVDETFFEDTTS